MKKWFEREFKRSANEILRSKRPEGRDGAKPASQWYWLKTALLVGATVLAAGCASTTVTEYDEQGNVVKVTESDESAFAIAAQSIQTKDNMLHASGWAVGVQPSAGIYGVGAFDVLAGSINAETGAANAASYAAMINASKVSLDVTANADGITAKAEGNSNANAATTPDTNAGSETAEGK